MSGEGGSNNSNENSGELKVTKSWDVLTVNDTQNISSSLILMGYPAENSVKEDEPVSVLYKEIGETVDDSAVIFKDIKSVEEWLRNRTDTIVSSIDYDTIRTDDFLSFSSDETNHNNSVEGASLPETQSSLNIVESTNVCNIGLNWEEFVLDSHNNFPPKNKLVSEIQNNTVKESQDNGFENTFNLSHYTSNLNSLKNDQRGESADSESLSTSVLDKNSDRPNQSPSKIINEILSKPVKPRPSFKNLGLPVVKIPKNWLINGKILGKGDISLSSSKSALSFLKNPSVKLTNINNDTLKVCSNPPKSDVLNRPSLLKKDCKSTSLLKEKESVASEQSVMVLPVKSVNKIPKNSLLKLYQSRSILKNNAFNNKRLPESSYSTNINVVHNISASKQSLPVPIALVAISTNKDEDSTEIIIKTGDGTENVYKGKTSDIMKATGSASTQNCNKNNPKLKTDDTTVNNLIVKLLGVSGETLEDLEGRGESSLKCPIDGCKYTSTKGSWLKVHILQHYGIRPFKCDYPGCTWAFYTNFRLKRHQEIHYKRKEFKCPVEGCYRSFSTIYNVNSHVKLHSRPTAVTCKIDNCNQEFQTRRSYEKHLRQHGIEHAPYVCHKDGCGKKYFTINSLNSHSRIHQHNEEELKCSYCGKLFDQPCRLKAHVNTHIGVKPYKCDFEGCKWAFTTSSKLRRHQRKHTQARKFVCNVCNKQFLRSEHLRDHNLKHFVKKSFICPLGDCGTVFSNKSSMYAHLKKHGNKKAKVSVLTHFPCPMDNCCFVFNTKESLRTHMQISHLTGLINNENSQDTIQLLTDDNMITLEGLQNNTTNSGHGMVSFNSMSQEGLLVGMSDLVQCIPAMEQGEFSESNSSNIVTHVVFTDDPNHEKSDTLKVTASLGDIKDSIGSARTGLPYQKQVSSLTESQGESSGGLHSASDVVLSAGLISGHDSLERSLLLQDELSGGDLYSSQEEGGLLGAAGESFQVLLLDPSTREQASEFEQSTINLRDLE